jgi:5-methylcytosine-specific restriction protein A
MARLMPGWEKTRADRQRDAVTYGPEYRRNRAVAMRRAGGRCEQLLDNGQRCGSRDRVQCDHIIPVTQHGTHHLDNLRVLCKPCHDKKTASEGGGYRKSGNRGAAAKDPDFQPRTRWLSLKKSCNRATM